LSTTLPIYSEYIVDFMRQHDVGAWLLQEETWEEGDKFNVDIGGYHIFRHNALRGENGRQHLFKGVAIILSPTFYQAWRAAGSLSPITTDPGDEFSGRIICLKLKFTSFDNRGKCIKGKYISIALMSVYFPGNDRQHKRFCTMFDSVLTDINLNTQIIVGSDINARIGTRTSDEHKQVLGSYGIA